MFSQELLSIVQTLSAAGGYPLLVGGAVRDMVLGKSPKDLDIEVYYLPVETLLQILKKFGQVNQVGVSFGIIKLKTSQMEYDISIPRRENKEGRGHKGFIVKPDPRMTPEEASSRRDFTINSMAYSFIEDRILDFHNGQRDLRNSILRHTSSAFAEDPLRVLRGFQFASRFNLTVDPETADLCRGLLPEYRDLALARVWGEWEKWAIKSTYPSAGLRFLRDTSWIELYPEINAILGTPQHAEWHPEGDVFLHTCHVVDYASFIARRDSLSDQEKLILMMTTLCHDFGKAITTINDAGILRSPGHDKAGETLALAFLESIGSPLDIRPKIAALVREHLSHIQIETARNVRRLAARLEPATITELARVIEADYSGRPPLPKGLPPQAHLMLKLASESQISESKPRPILMGKHLIEHKLIHPGPAMGKLVKLAYEAQLDGAFTTLDEALAYITRFL